MANVQQVNAGHSSFLVTSDIAADYIERVAKRIS